MYFSALGGFVVSIGVVGGLIRCFLCLRQVDLKAFVAYSSVFHMRFGLAGIRSFLGNGVYGIVFMIVGHGFCSSCLFYALYVFYKRFFTRSVFFWQGASSDFSTFWGIVVYFSCSKYGGTTLLSVFF